MRIPLHKSLLLFHDILSVMLAIVLALVIYSRLSIYFDYQNINLELFMGYLFIICCTLIAMNEYDLYKYQVVLNKARHFTYIYKSLFISLIAVIFISFLFKFEDVSFSRVLVGFIYFNLLVILVISRVVVIPSIFFTLVKRKLINRNLLIVGSGKLSRDHVEELIGNHSYFNIRGIVDDGESELGQEVNGIPVLGAISQLQYFVEVYNIQDILVASNCKSDDRLHEIIENCKESNRTVHIVSELYNIALQKISIEEIGKVSAFRYVPPNPGSRLFYPYLKRCFDIVISLVAIVALFPIWILITLLVKLNSPGPIFYKANAIGKDGKGFQMYKFRSMYVNAPTKLHEDKVRKMILENGATTKLVQDPRITFVGKFLRKSSLDEIPQLLNVLKGQMSLVGPRPCLPYEYELMKEWQKERCSIKPGITGIWQIKGRDEVLFNEQVILDLYYKEHRSLWMDMEIIVGTIPVVLFGRGGA